MRVLVEKFFGCVEPIEIKYVKMFKNCKCKELLY